MPYPAAKIFHCTFPPKKNESFNPKFRKDMTGRGPVHTCISYLTDGSSHLPLSTRQSSSVKKSFTIFFTSPRLFLYT
jgi:hypothetical protein